MDFDKVRAGVEEISVSDSFVVDIEPLSHVAERESSANSRISRNHSRKGSIRGGCGEKKINSTAANGTAAAVEASTIVKTAGTSHGGSMPENPVVVAFGAIDHVTNPKIHHQITIKKGSLSPPSESKHSGKRSAFRHSQLPWSTDPRKILLFFATLSSMGTVLLIYFTLSMSKLNDDRLE